MIARLVGPVISAGSGRLVVGVGGVGLAVTVTPSTLAAARPGASIALHTSLIVREDDLSLYGFETEDELHAFDLLRGVSGVGPKSAIGVLAALSPGELAAAVESGDERAFKAVSGIGPKTAKLLILQLAGKIAATPVHPARAPDARADVLEALTGLGWPERTASDAVDRALLAAPDAAGETGALLRAAFAILGTGARP